MAAASILLEFVIEGPPVSHQTRRKERVREYRNEVGARATDVYPGAQPFTGMVRIEITFFYDTVAGDVDNIAKPIPDGLKGAVIADDAEVMDVLASKRPIAGSRLVDPPEQALRLLAAGREFVHVRVMAFSLQEIEAERLRSRSTSRVACCSRSRGVTAARATRSWLSRGRMTYPNRCSGFGRT